MGLVVNNVTTSGLFLSTLYRKCVPDKEHTDTHTLTIYGKCSHKYVMALVCPLPESGHWAGGCLFFCAFLTKCWNLCGHGPSRTITMLVSSNFGSSFLRNANLSPSKQRHGIYFAWWCERALQTATTLVWRWWLRYCNNVLLSRSIFLCLLSSTGREEMDHNKLCFCYKSLKLCSRSILLRLAEF